ncbi:hypothetical protein [Rhodococcoides fascians]|uniref:hypothetical protein n=1 Tax=Rhodococcoides fascians TaxID=1828 RepID=UPI000ADB8BAD|nr:hypothetical protein [Rhodococcus fascians]
MRQCTSDAKCWRDGSAYRSAQSRRRTPPVEKDADETATTRDTDADGAGTL